MVAQIEGPTAGTKKAREKQERIQSVASQEGMEAMVAEITALQIEAAKVQAQIAEKTADSERLLATVIRPLQKQVEAIAKQAKKRLARVQVYVTEHRDQLMPGEKKSFELPTAVVGFATSTKPKVTLANEGDEWCDVVERLEALPWGEDYVRYPEPEVDKQALIEDRNELTAKQLSAAGLRIEQGEKFYVEPKSLVAETAKE